MAGKNKAADGGEIILDFGEASPKQARFYASRTLFTAYGGARGGGKTHAVRIKAVGGAVSWPGIRILIIRRTYPELQSNHIDPILRLVPRTLASYNGTTHALTFINGSVIKFGHYQGRQAENEYQGQEYDWIFVDEATQFAEEEFRFLGGLLRGVSDIPKRFYLTCNPGGIGHRWVKRLFIDRRFRTGSACPEENENPEDYSFIFASVDDNKYLMASSPGYVKMLSALPERIRAAHRYGNWDALSGCYFDEFDRNIHTTEPPFIPPGWTRYRAFDYGLDMFACLWIAVDENGRCCVYREYCAPGLIVSKAAEAMLSRTMPDENIAVTFAPPDMWSRQKDSGKTMADIFLENGAAIVRAGNDRVQGHMQIKEMLRTDKNGTPRLTISKQCRTLTESLAAIQADELDPDDCAKEPHDITHAVDALRYFCVSRTMSAQKPEKPAFSDTDDGEDYESYMVGGSAGRNYMNY